MMILKVIDNLSCFVLLVQSVNWALNVPAVIPDEEDAGVERDPSLDSMSSRFTNDSSEHPLCGTFISVFICWIC